MKLHDARYWVNRPIDSEKDWIDDQPNWIESYVHSAYHPHRMLIIDAVKSLGPIRRLLEVGCGSGSNLLRIHEAFPEMKLFGLDISGKLIARARDYLPQSTFKVGSYFSVPYANKSFDVVVADATLMYAGPKDIGRAMNELDRVTNSIIIVDRYDKSLAGIRNGHVWARNYPKIFEKLGYEVTTAKIKKEDWPQSKGWAKLGYVWVATTK